jgi:hypothetical protein
MQEKTPDQIRRETVPVKHTGLLYGLLGGVLGAAVWFGGWGLLHQEQVRRYPEYCAHAIRSRTAGLSLFGAPAKRERGMSTEQLRYELLRYGNEDHRYDAEIIRHGWYPREASPAPWVYDKGAVKAVHADSPALVFKWPLTLTLLTFLGALIAGLATDYRYRRSGLRSEASIGALVFIEGEMTYCDYDRDVGTAEGPDSVNWRVAEVRVSSISAITKKDKREKQDPAA